MSFTHPAAENASAAIEEGRAQAYRSAADIHQESALRAKILCDLAQKMQLRKWAVQEACAIVRGIRLEISPSTPAAGQADAVAEHAKKLADFFYEFATRDEGRE